MRRMTIVLWALLAAVILPYVWSSLSAVLRKKEIGKLDNHHPRSQHTTLTGPAARAHAAQQNAWEALGVFAPCALVAHFGNPGSSTATILALAWVGCRVLHGIAYVANIPPVRSALFTLALLASVGLLLVGGKVL
jgi:uncharacterized MAPEG superfamily protein